MNLNPSEPRHKRRCGAGAALLTRLFRRAWLGAATLALGLLAVPLATLAAPAGGPCILPRELGAGSWFLASMASVDLCTLLNPGAPPVIAAATPRPTATPRPRATPRPTATPAPRVHIVVEGETLSEIARLYGVSVEELLQINNLDIGDTLSIGMELRLERDGAPPMQTSTPALVALVACPRDIGERRVDLPYEPIRIAAQGGVLYMLAGGQLYTLPESTLLLAGALQPMPIAPPEGQAGAIPVQELVDLAVSETAGTLALLDKSGNLFSYDPLSKRWDVLVPAQRVPNVWLDPQFLAIAALDGVVYGLDVDGARLWRMSAELGRPTIAREEDRLARAVDLAPMAGRLYLLNADGALTDIRGQPYHAALPRLAWPADLNASGGSLLAVDADERRVLVLGAQGEQSVTLAAPGMQRLRSAALSGRILYAIAGPYLYRVDLDASMGACATPGYDDRLLFHGRDLLQELPAFEMPIARASLPSGTRFYPGARRLYRLGVHEGVDLFEGTAPNLVYGSPVVSIADGVVTRIDHDFREMTPAEYVAMINEIHALGHTPERYLDKLRGQQVWVEHAPGIVSRYTHLTSVAPGLQVGDRVTVGKRLGGVGVSGTSSGVYGSQDGFHLHWELWIHDRYLGFGLTVRETMRIWGRLF